MSSLQTSFKQNSFGVSENAKQFSIAFFIFGRKDEIQRPKTNERPTRMSSFENIFKH